MRSFFYFSLAICLLALNIPVSAQDTGKWVISVDNARYDFSGARFPNKMAHFKDESVIIAGQQTPTGPGSPSYAFIDRTKDGGKTWSRLYELKNADFAFYQISHPSPRHIIALAEKWAFDSMGNNVKQTYVMTSADTGLTWLTHDLFGPAEYPRSLNFKDKYGIITITTATKNELWHTADYGVSWQKKNLPAELPHADGKILSSDEIIFGTYLDRKAAYSDNFLGNNTGTWDYFTYPEHFSTIKMTVIDKNTIWSASAKPSGQGNTSRNIIMGTKDGGQTWTTPLDVFEDNLFQRNGLNAIAFADNMRGAAVGSNVSYLTEDGGLTWKNYSLGATFTPTTQSVMYYYNQNTRKSTLLTLLNGQYVLRYDFDAVEDTTGGGVSINESDLKAGNKLNIFPNPANSVLHIDPPANVANSRYSIKIIALDGKVISNTSYVSGTTRHTEQIAHLPKGSYIVQMISNAGVSNSLFIKE